MLETILFEKRLGWIGALDRLSFEHLLQWINAWLTMTQTE